jgi:hypothetical protein
MPFCHFAGAAVSQRMPLERVFTICRDSQTAGSALVGGPSQGEVQSQLVAGLPQYISQYCAKDKDEMLSSEKSIRYKLVSRDLLNTVNGHKVIRVNGTLYWSYWSKAASLDPSAGNPLSILMTDDPEMNPDHAAKWEFLGFGPWSDILGSFRSCDHFR